ncbi:hypothetical protein GMPD_17170 [Geomonas paludis]|uniref:Uncharacterized protein n=1 Tax=Geomonas paludis TaxID=2740185 RepID=A0A6V8MUD6_9BACT|nr:hypothetical protein GMPD_17170 [Geomonas paludis]
MTGALRLPVEGETGEACRGGACGSRARAGFRRKIGALRGRFRFRGRASVRVNRPDMACCMFGQIIQKFRIIF